MSMPTSEGGSIKSGWLSKDEERSRLEGKNENEHLEKFTLFNTCAEANGAK